jgi:hypothetical protein
MPGVFDPVAGASTPTNPLDVPASDPGATSGPATTPVPPQIDLSQGVGLTGADHYNVMRLTRAQTYLSGAGTAGYPDLATTAALAPTDWQTLDSHIQSLGGQPGYGLGVGQLMDHLSSPGADKVPVADIATLQRTMIAQGFLPPGASVTGTWDANSSAAFKAMEDHNYNLANQGQKAGGASITQFLGWLTDVLPSKVGQALVGTAKFLFAGIPHTAERFGIELARAPGGIVAPWGSTQARDVQTQQILAAHGLKTGTAGGMEDLGTVLSMLPILKGAGVLAKGATEAGATALSGGIADEGASALIRPAEGTISQGLVSKSVRTLVAKSVAKDFATDPAAVGDMLSSFATKPMSLRAMGEGFLQAADWVAQAKSTPLGQLATAGLNAATQTSIYERGVANLSGGTVLPNIKVGAQQRSPFGEAIDNTSALGASWNTSGPLSILGNPLDLSAFIWAPSEALDIKGFAKATIGQMALSMDRITPTSDLMPLINNTGMNREQLVNAFGGEPYLKQFMRYTALQAAIKRDATLWVDSVKGLKPGSDGWEMAMQDKAHEIETGLKANPLKMESAISSATSFDMLNQVKYMFQANPEVLARRGQAEPIFQNWADAMSALNGTTATDATVNTFSRGAKLWTDANQEALNSALEPFFKQEAPLGAVPPLHDAQGNVVVSPRAGGPTVAGSSYVFGEQMAGKLGETLGSDATIAVRRADNALGSAQQLASWKVVWDRLGSVTRDIDSRLADAAAGEPGGLVELPKHTQVGDLQAAGFSDDAITAMRDPKNLGLVGARMTPQQATDFLSNLTNRVSELKTAMNKYNPETAAMDRGQLSTYSNHLAQMAPRDVTLADDVLHNKLLNLGYQPIAMHPGAITLNHVGAGTADGLFNAANVSPIRTFLGVDKMAPEQLSFMRTNQTQNELGTLARTDPAIGQNGKEILSRVYDTAQAASDAGMSIFGTNLKMERTISDLRQLSPGMLQKYGGFSSEQAWNVYGAIRRGAAFGFDISKPIQTLRNLGEALSYNGLPGMEDAIRTLVSLKPNTKVPFVDGVAGHILNLPDELARLRDFVQFGLSPQFTAAKAFKTKILRGTEGLPFDFMPANRIADMAAESGNADEFYSQFNDNFRKVMGESRGNAYATLLDNPDFGIKNPGSGMFGHTNEHGIALDSWRLAQQARAEQGIAADADLTGGQYQAIKSKINQIYGYGARSGLEKTANYVFFPLSFDLKVGKALGGWMLHNPAWILMTTMGLKSYEAMNGPDNNIGGFIDRYLPLLGELNKLNFFTGGFHTQFTYAGGRNTALYNMGKDINALFHGDPRLAAYVPISVDDNNLPNALGIMGNLIPAWRQIQSGGKAIQSQIDANPIGLAAAGAKDMLMPGSFTPLPPGGGEQWQVDNYYQETKALKQAVAIQLGNAGLKPSFSTLTDPFGNPNSKISPEFFNQVQAELGKIEARYPAGAAFAKASSANYQTRVNALDEMLRKPVKSRPEASMLYFAAAYYDLQAQAQSTGRANAAAGAKGRALYQAIAGAMAQGTTPPTLPGDLDPGQVAQLRRLALGLAQEAGPEFTRQYNLLFKSELGPLQAYDQAPGAISPSGTAAA